MTVESIVDVTEASHLYGFVVRLEFEDGTVGEVDLEPLMQGPVFEDLIEDEDHFRSFVLDPEAGTIVWPNGADLSPRTLRRQLRQTSSVAS